MKQRPARWRAVATAITLFAQLVVALMPALSSAQTAAAQRPPVQRGQEYYEQSRFDEAITLLRDLVDRGQLSGDDLQRARELLARSYVKKGHPDPAKDMFKAILQTTPEWRPDPIRVPPDETAVFDQALKEFKAEQATPPAPTPAPDKRSTPATPPPVSKPESVKAAPKPKPAKVIQPGATGEKKSKKMWLYAAGGALLVGIVAVAAGGGGGGSSTPQPLSGFPPPPSQ